MKPTRILLTAIGTLLLAAACQTEQLPTDGSPFAPGEERPLIITPVVSSAAATRATTDPVSVTLIGGNLALTLSRDAAAAASTQTAVYTAAAEAPLAYAHQATIDTLVTRGICANADEAAARARALYVTAAGDYPLAAVGTALPATTTRTEQIVPSLDLGMGTNPVTTTTRLPFALHARRTATDAPIAVAADGTATLPLRIASAGVMLRMKCKATATVGETRIVINSVRCLPTGETAPRESSSITDQEAGTASRVMTATVLIDGTPTPAYDTDGIGTDHVLFGTLAPGQKLAAGSVLADISVTLTTNTGSGNTSEEKKVFTIVLPRDATPQAGQLLTYTVHVNHSVATIVGEVEISDFVPGNGNDGEDIGSGSTVTASGMEPLDHALFCEKYPTWVVTGGGTPDADATVLKNVRDALDRIYAPVDAAGNYTGDYTGTARIDLQLPEVTTLPMHTIATQPFGAFDSYQQLRSISAPQAKSIGNEAFNNCAALATISLPQAKSIGDGAFYGCPALTTISLPKATDIGDYAFEGCAALKTITLPQAKSIGQGAFNGCEALKTISLPQATSIGNAAFSGCGTLTTISLPQATSIGNVAFASCEALATITLPQATDIGNQAFTNCTALTRLELTAAGNFELHIDAFHSYKFDAGKCTLLLNPNKKDGGTGTPSVAADGKTWGATGKEQTWLAIDYLAAP